MGNLKLHRAAGRAMRALALSASFLCALALGAEPVKVVFDTDMLTDFDDVGALACLHALADAGECEILATVSCTRGNASVAAVEVINGYYGRGDLPVGAPKGDCVLGGCAGAKAKVDPTSPLDAEEGTPRPAEGRHLKYRKLAADYPQWVRHLDADDAPDAKDVYRRVLSAAPDGSVVICTVGFLTNLRNLLDSQPDAISPLDGRALVARKVKKLVSMACAYPSGKEYNSMWDWKASKAVFENWPTPVVFSDWQYGADVFAGRAVAEMKGPRNPVKDVFAGNIPSREEIASDPARWQRCCFGVGGRSAWDETAVLAAVRGEESLFNVHRGTYRMVGTDGADEWAPDEENGPHLRITEKTSKTEVGRIIDELICRGPSGDGGTAKPILICNEDNDRFFYLEDRWHTAEGIRAYFDGIAKGGAMTHYFMCVNGQRTSYDSKVWEPIWLGANDPRSDGKSTNDLWCVNAKKVHDRGLDPWAIWIGCARERGVSPWISMRMNDTHWANIRNAFRNESRFYARQDLWCGPECPAWDYSKAEVREHALALVKEILGRWDADGIELDWLRHPRHFPEGRGAELAHVITGFIRDVRRETELAAKRRGHPVKVGVRVPTDLSAALPLGLDAETWAKEGLVDLVVPCNFYDTADFAWDARAWIDRLRAANAKVTVVPGFCNMARAHPGAPLFPMDEDRAFLRGWAALYGDRGLYVFNAFYHRDETKDWFLSGGLAPDRLAEGPRRFPVGWHDIRPKGCDAGVQLPRSLARGRTLRIRAAKVGAEDAVDVVLGFDGPTDRPTVTLNGVAAAKVRTVDRKALFLPPDVKATFAWRFPASALTNGVNSVGVSSVADSSAQIVWGEIAVK